MRYPSDNQLFGFNYTDGRFTDGPDTQPAASSAYTGLWIEQLAPLLGTNVAVKNSLDGGTNYAYGDAATGSGTKTETKTYLGQTFSITLNNMGQQVTDYLATNPTANAQTVYVLWGGSNDILDAAGAGTDPVAAATTAVSNELQLVQRLMAAGGTKFIVPDVPPLGAIAQASGAPAAEVTALNTASGLFAQGLATGLNALKQASMNPAVTFYEPDVFTLLQTVAASPMTYAFGSIATPAQGVSGSPDTYLIWDGLHPTTTGHHYVAAAAANLISPLAASTTTLSVPSASLAGQPVVAAATVVSAKTGNVPTGLVTLFDGTAVVGSGPLDASGKVQITFTPTEAAGANLALTAIYAGDVFNNKSAPATGSVALLNTAVGTTTTLAASSTTLDTGASVTFTATVAPAVTTYGTPSGTVTFLDGTTTLGTGTLTGGGTATYTTTALTAGTHQITATYAATGLFGASTSAAVSVVVTAPSITPAVTPASLAIKSGGSGSVALSAASVGGYTGTVALSCGTLPAHFSCSFSPATLSVSSGSATPQASTLTIATNVAGGTTAALQLPAKPMRLTGREVWSAGLFFPGLLGLMLLGKRRRSAAWLKLAVVLLLGSAATAGLMGCGGGNSNNAPTGSYTVPVIFTPAASGSTNLAPQTVNVTVTVQ